MAFAFPALADLRTVSMAYELNPSHVNVPPTPNSSMRFSECGECDAITAQLTAETLFKVEGKKVSFRDFREAIKLAKRSDHSGIVLQHHLASNAVVFVSVSL